MEIDIVYNGNILIKVDGKKIALDPESKVDADFIFISHAHLDHMPLEETVTPTICSNFTKEMIQYRRNFEMINSINFDSFDINKIHLRQLNSGHIIGSTSLLIETKNKKIFYTGDICDKYRFHLKAAEIPKSDIMIVESTYGNPFYKLPSITEVVENSNKWIKSCLEEKNSVVLMGYPLGKAQILTKIAETYDVHLIVNDNINEINNLCKKYGFNCIKSIPYSNASEIIKNEQFIGVFPISHSNLTTKSKFPIKTAAFTGWGLDENYKNQLGVDKVFPLSDHCDFNGLIKIVKESSPTKVYTTHGYEEELAYEIRERLGIDAQPISKNQRNLKQFIS